MLEIKPSAAKSGSKYANHFAMLPLPDLKNTYFGLASCYFCAKRGFRGELCR